MSDLPTITDSTTAWPFPAATESRRAGRDEWLEIDEQTKDQLLNCVPPVYVPNGFAVGEEADFDARGCAIHALVLSFTVAGQERHFLREISMNRQERQHHQLRLMHALFGEPKTCGRCGCSGGPGWDPGDCHCVGA